MKVGTIEFLYSQFASGLAGLFSRKEERIGKIAKRIQKFTLLTFLPQLLFSNNSFISFVFIGKIWKTLVHRNMANFSIGHI